MKKILFPFLMAGLLLGLVATAMRPVAAEPAAILASTTLNPSLDTTLFEESGDLSNGRGQHIFVGNTGPINSNNARRALIAFDVAGSIPAGATILTATLRLNLSRVNGGEAGNARHDCPAPRHGRMGRRHLRCLRARRDRGRCYGRGCDMVA